MSQKGFCVPCNRNGHSCETENMVDGQFICIFCEDDVDCPFTQRMKREQKLGDTPSKQEKSAMKTTATGRRARVRSSGMRKTPNSLQQERILHQALLPVQKVNERPQGPQIASKAHYRSYSDSRKGP
jgi:hypothetical protein